VFLYYGFRLYVVLSQRTIQTIISLHELRKYIFNLFTLIDFRMMRLNCTKMDFQAFTRKWSYGKPPPPKKDFNDHYCCIVYSSYSCIECRRIFRQMNLNPRQFFTLDYRLCRLGWVMLHSVHTYPIYNNILYRRNYLPSRIQFILGRYFTLIRCSHGIV